MPSQIFVDPSANPGPVIRVGGACYYQVGPSPQTPNKSASDIQGTFSSCDQCNSSSSSSGSSVSSSSSSGGPCSDCTSDIPVSVMFTVDGPGWVVNLSGVMTYAEGVWTKLWYEVDIPGYGLAIVQVRIYCADDA